MRVGGHIMRRERWSGARALRRWHRSLLVLLMVGAVIVPASAPPSAYATNPIFAFGVGTTGIDRGFAIGADAAGNTYVAGGYGDTADFDPGPA